MNETVANLNTDLVKNDSMFFIRKIFIRKWALKTPEPWENVEKIPSLKCLSCNF